MSSEALAWVFRLDVKPSSVKFTLVALCECANYKTGRITPSIAHLCEITGQDRKTVIANVAELERRGLIRDTGERCGKTGQIKVYSAAIGTVPQTEQFQKRNSSGNGLKQSQKRDTEPSWEPSSSEPKGSSESKRAAKPPKVDEFPCPEGVDPIDWDAIRANRKAKRAPMTAGAYRQITNKLDAWEREGWPPGPIVANAAERGWTTVFETDEMKAAKNDTANRRYPNSPRATDGIAAALDRRLGLDHASGTSGRRDVGEGAGHSHLAITGPNTLR